MALTAPYIKGVNKEGLIVLTTLIERHPERDLLLQAIAEGDYAHPVMRLIIQAAQIEYLAELQAKMYPYRLHGVN